MSHPKLCVVIPVYNHSTELASIASAMAKHGLPVLLVDDGSSQACREVMIQLAETQENVTLVKREKNGGKGAAVKTGFRFAFENGFTHALQIDADGQHDLSDVARFTALMEQHPTAMIAGYPKYDESIPKHRFYGRYATHIWIWINTLSLSIKDSMCGFRIYPLSACCEIIDRRHVGDRMDFDSEIIVRWYWAGLPLQQIETCVTYPKDGISHFKLLHDNSLISWMHTRLFFGMLLRFPRLLARKVSRI